MSPAAECLTFAKRRGSLVSIGTQCRLCLSHCKDMSLTRQIITFLVAFSSPQDTRHRHTILSRMPLLSHPHPSYSTIKYVKCSRQAFRPMFSHSSPGCPKFIHRQILRGGRECTGLPESSCAQTASSQPSFSTSTPFSFGAEESCHVGMFCASWVLAACCPLPTWCQQLSSPQS